LDCDLRVHQFLRHSFQQTSHPHHPASDVGWHSDSKQIENHIPQQRLQREQALLRDLEDISVLRSWDRANKILASLAMTANRLTKGAIIPEQFPIVNCNPEAVVLLP
jgi:hypothetical protein